MTTKIQTAAATLDTADHIAAGYSLREACRLAIANDDEIIGELKTEAGEADDDAMVLMCADALRTQGGQGPAGARWDVAGVILDARLAAMAD